MAIVGLLGCSALMVVTRTMFFKLLVLIGLVALTMVKHHPIKKVPHFDNIPFWEAVAIIGGMVYLMGADVNHQGIEISDKQKKE